MKKFNLFLLAFLLICFVACKQNTDDDEKEAWDYVFSIADVQGIWKASDSLYDYEVYVGSTDLVIVEKIIKSSGDNEIYETYFNSNANAYIKTCKINNKRTKLICPQFGSNIVLAKK